MLALDMPAEISKPFRGHAATMLWACVAVGVGALVMRLFVKTMITKVLCALV